jgi:hypothetical protein
MDCHNSIFLEGEGLSRVMKPVGVMLAIGVVFEALNHNYEQCLITDVKDNPWKGEPKQESFGPGRASP